MYHFIVNPRSRSGSGKRIWSRLQKELDAQQVPYQCYMTEYPGHARILSHTIGGKGTREEPVYLIVLGGDGTIHEILTGIDDLDSVIFGFIPTGSGNDFCRGMKLPNAPLDALRLILSHERICPVDVPVLHPSDGEESYRFGFSTGIGYDAAVCHEVEKSSQKSILNRLGLGKFVYLFIALKQMLSVVPFAGTIVMDGCRTEHFDRMFFAAVMNLRYEGGGFMFCPEAKPDDGKIDVILAEGLSKGRMLLTMPRCFGGRHTNARGIHIYSCKDITITCEKPAAVHIDGEPRGFHREISVSLENKRIRMILP
ncbi:MAG: diacylglycerol kinase family lipid kinase [Blautia sp.]|nr:diacylglycerol kinase family lipid kinase [Blautia sp.]